MSNTEDKKNMTNTEDKPNNNKKKTTLERIDLFNLTNNKSSPLFDLEN